jgi:O-acetylhomoserine/O-acetylserine sulfhydrylase-like pyridoxal-dependent enzyme
MSTNPGRLATRCAHGDASRRGPGGPNEPFQRPIAQSTVFDLGTSAEAEAIFSGTRKGYAYSRFGNPSVDGLAEMIADMEGGAEALVTSSGNAAVLCAVTSGLEGRDGPLVTHHDVYGGSFELLRILSSIHPVPVQIVDSTNVMACPAAQTLTPSSSALSPIW